jgi:radical SAM protein with 4Fe4S-binding SPASM domain
MSNEYVKFSGNNPFGTQAKLILHFDKLHEYLTTGDTSCPIFMEVGLTNKCNMACYWCITENGRDNKAGDHIDIKALKKFLNEFAELGGKAITYAGQGEPTFYPHFEEAVLSAKKATLQLGMMTNGVYKKRYNSLIGENFEWIRISLDTLDTAKYKEWKEVDGVKIIKKNVEALSNYPVKVGINCNVGPNITLEHTKQLIDWVEESSDIAYLQFRPILPRYYKEAETTYKKTGTVEINLEVWDYLDKHTINPKINLSDDKRRDLKNGTAFNFRSCEGHFFEPILAATGEVKICTYHPMDKRLTFGNIYDSSFKEIWNSEQRKEAIKFIRSFNYKARCQVCCKLSEPNKLLDFLKHPEECKDINFL